MFARDSLAIIGYSKSPTLFTPVTLNSYDWRMARPVILDGVRNEILK
jgi:hypothetical protein